MVRAMRISLRQVMRASYQGSLERSAQRVTDKMLRQASQSDPERLEVVIAGARRQAAYMNIGWHPETETPAKDHQGHLLGHTLMTLHLDRPLGGW